MEKSRNYDAFVKAFNNFDSRPLSGENLKRFYIDDFTKQSVEDINTTIRITERFKKMLIIGHRGCGKSTILNKVAEDLKDEYQVVLFSAAEVINMMDVETVDILLATYLQVLESVSGDRQFKPLFDKFDELVKLFKKEINLETTDVKVLGLLSFKFKVEPESRATIRKKLFDRVQELQKNLSEACSQIQQNRNKEILIIIDDLDKLDTTIAENIFLKNFKMVIVPEAKILFTFPLDTYYCDAYIRITDIYESKFIPLVNLYTSDGEYLEFSHKSLEKLILRRIDEELVDKDAMKYAIDKSGGLLRDMVKFMQNTCKLAIVDKSDVISTEIAESAVNEYINDYYRVFDFSIYAEKVRAIVDTKQKVDNETLVYLLKHLFVLEYRHGKELWYDAHPCMKKALEIEKGKSVIIS
ncbi:MAG: AAA family ATPase [Desulfobacterales bacterium]|nr:AAA family ATPase [Desulfobacterales bacterium]